MASTGSSGSASGGAGVVGGAMPLLPSRALPGGGMTTLPISPETWQGILAGAFPMAPGAGGAGNGAMPPTVGDLEAQQGRQTGFLPETRALEEQRRPTMGFPSPRGWAATSELRNSAREQARIADWMAWRQQGRQREMMQYQYDLARSMEELRRQNELERERLQQEAQRQLAARQFKQNLLMMLLGRGQW